LKIILLSGGQGKRLWPISNKLPKQFISFFKTENGAYESIFQRVIEQLNAVSLLKDTFITTTKEQFPILRKQLRYDVPVIVEPKTMDTFPAISLSIAFLLKENKIFLDEVVCFCPVDLYADKVFFECLKKAEDMLKKEGNLVLIGIKPTEPSKKYGYIVPKKDSFRVERFVEKPTVEEAAKLISQGSLWNAGVFCFKTKFFIEVLESKNIPIDYDFLVKQYENLPKISFDYEVVEKITNIFVIPYSGSWNDIGTWDVICEKIGENIKGRGFLSQDCQNTHIINNLEIPIIGVGLEDIVIAASDEGILISKKARSSDIKKYL